MLHFLFSTLFASALHSMDLMPGLGFGMKNPEPVLRIWKLFIRPNIIDYNTR
jgi:hypothetical protein